jgi:hypothetical protein
MAEIYFANWPLGISILKPHFPLRKTSRVEDLMTHGILDLDDQDQLWVSGTSGLLSTSHFKSPEAHFPEGLDQLSPVPFKINGSYSLSGLLFWNYTSRKFSLLNIRETLIWTVLGIFVAERLKLSFSYASISK